MEIQHLRHLVAASESASFAKAAKKCFTSRQNVAHSVKVIEGQLGVTLFERRGNEMILTPAGIETVRAARDIVERVDNLSVMFVDSDDSNALLSVAVSNNLFAGIPSSTDAFIYTYSDRLRILERDCEQCYELVRSGVADIAIVMSMKREFPECNVREIARSRSYATVNPESKLAQKKELTIMDLDGQDLLLMSKPPFQYEPLYIQMDILGFSNHEASVIASTSSMVHMVRKHDAMGIVSKRFATHPPEGVKAIPIADPRLDWHFYLLFQMDVNKFRSIANFIKGIQETFQSETELF